MKKVYLLKLSTEEEKTEMIINQFIEGISRNTVINWLTNLIRPLDSNKFMLVGEVEGASDEPTTPGIGVKVVRGSQNMKETEKILNSALMEMEMDEEEPKSFLSIFNPIENMWSKVKQILRGLMARAEESTESTCTAPAVSA